MRRNPCRYCTHLSMQTSLETLGSRAVANEGAAVDRGLAGEALSNDRRPVLRAIDRCAESLVVAALLAELALVLTNVLARVHLHRSFLWADEVARLSLSILAFIGGAVAYRRRDHAFVRIVLNLLPPPVERACMALADIIVLLIAVLTAVASAEFIASSWGERTPILQLPAGVIALPLPAGMALLALFALDNLSRAAWRITWRLGAGIIAV